MLKTSFGPPLDHSEALPVVLSYEKAEWWLPSLLEDAVRAHPVYRFVASEAIDADIGMQVIRRLRWAAQLSPDRCWSYRMQDCAEGILELLGLDVECSEPTADWVDAAIVSETFWTLVAGAIDFGVHYNARRLFLDGRLQSSADKRILNGKVQEPYWLLVIDETMGKCFNDTGRLFTPKELREFLGSNEIPGSGDVILSFEDPRFSLVPGIKWSLFQKYANEAKKTWSDHRSNS